MAFAAIQPMFTNDWQKAANQSKCGLAIAVSNQSKSLRVINRSGNIFGMDVNGEIKEINSLQVKRFTVFAPVTEQVIDSIAANVRVFTHADVDNLVNYACKSPISTTASESESESESVAPPVGLKATITAARVQISEIRSTAELIGGMELDNEQLDDCLNDLILKAIELKKLL